MCAILIAFACVFTIGTTVCGILHIGMQAMCIAVQRVVVIIITSVLLARLTDVKRKYDVLEDALDQIFKLGFDKCGDLYARIDENYAKKMLDTTEERIKSLYWLTWAVEITFMIEIVILLSILIWACWGVHKVVC